MGDVDTASPVISHHGIVRFNIPSPTPGPADRTFFGLPKPQSLTDAEVEIRDFRKSEEVAKGPAGLDVQGFAYINHESKLAQEDSWFEGNNVENVYFPEVCDLVCKVTGASRAVPLNCAFRRKSADSQKDPYQIPPKGSIVDQIVEKFPRNGIIVAGKNNDREMSGEPIRTVHCDFTLEGLRNNIRNVRTDVREMGSEAIKAEEAVKRGQEVRVPRYAGFSVWRPLKTIQRDGLAVSDWRTVDKKDIMPYNYRVTSGVNESGEFLLDAANLAPPKGHNGPTWYCAPNQTSNEVIIIKLADTAAEKDPNIAGGCFHCCPEVKVEEKEDLRESIEVRLVAFWD